MSSIRNIPVDILYTIAQNVGSPRELVLVCKRWHDIVLFAPSLWTNIHIRLSGEPPLPGYLTTERIARAALRRAGPTTKLCLYLDIDDNISEHPDSTIAVVDMIKSRGYQFIRELTFGGYWDWCDDIPQESISPLFSRLVGEWDSLLCLHLGTLPSHIWGSTALLSFLDSAISTASALQSISISSSIPPLIGRKLARKRSLIDLDITSSRSGYATLRFSVWPNIKSLNISTTRSYHPFLEHQLDLRAIDPPSSAEDIVAFPLLTRAVFINHTLDFRFKLRLESLTDLVLRYVHIKAMGPHSVEMPLLRNLSVEMTGMVDSIVAPRLETLSIGPLLAQLPVTDYLSELFPGHSQQLDPVHLDLRPLYNGRVPWDGAVPLAAISCLRRVERISIGSPELVCGTKRCMYRMLKSVKDDDENSTKAMVMLPKWKEMDLEGDDVPDWLEDIVIARQVAGFPVQLNHTKDRCGEYWRRNFTAELGRYLG